MNIGVAEIFRRNRQQRTPINKNDISTVFSILPKDIKEVKHTLECSKYEIPAGTPENPSSLTVHASSWWREIDPEQPLLEIPVSSVQIAESVVRDYSNGIIMCDMGDVRPGLFWMPGDITVSELKIKHKDVLNQAIKRQENWFKALIRLADSFWARTNGNPLSISDDCRLAARMLNVNDRPWLMEFKMEDMKLEPCPACGQLRNSKFPVCMHCKTIVDRAKFDLLGLKTAV